MRFNNDLQTLTLYSASAASALSVWLCAGMCGLECRHLSTALVDREEVAHPAQVGFVTSRVVKLRDEADIGDAGLGPKKERPRCICGELFEGEEPFPYMAR